MRTRTSGAPVARPAIVAVALGALLLAAVCSSPGARAAAPTLRILSPADHAIIGNGSPVYVVFVVSGFNLTAPASNVSGPTPGEGYVNVFVNGNLSATVDQDTVVLPLASGFYTITLRLVLANGTPLNPDVSASIAITVTQGPALGSPGIKVTYVEITYPTPGVVLNDDVTVSFRVTNFTLVPPGHAAPVPNEGHVAVYVDGLLYQAVSTFDPVFFSDFPDGYHTVRMQLVDNAGTPLTPDASSAVTFRIQSSPVVDITPYLLDVQVVLAIAILVALFYRGWGLREVSALGSRLRRPKA